MKQIFVLTVLLYLSFTTNANAASISANLTITVGGGEEFVGPFANWINAKTGKRFDGTGSSLCTAAVGNGVTVDTTSLQSCLSALSSTNAVLWLPAGTYLSGPLTIPSGTYFSLIGEDPATTTLKYNVAIGSHHAMIYLNGTAYSRINRITLDGQNVANVGVLQEWDGVTGVFDTGNEYADDVFANFHSVNTNFGIDCGDLGQGCAETAVLRGKFIIPTGHCISMGNSNALDMWVWYSSFTGCATALDNTLGAGNLHGFYNNFSGSTVADLGINNTGLFTMLGNYSAASAQFINAAGTGNPNVMVIEGNTVLNTTTSPEIAIGDQGPIISFDNVISGRVGATAPQVSLTNGASDILSTGNTYTVGTANTCGAGGSVQAANRCHALGDSIVARSSASPPALPGTPPNKGRTIFEVPGASSAATIQTAINSACNATGRNVVHLQAGNYSISSTLVVPVSNCQIIGDGYWTFLKWSGAAGGLVMQLTGPSHVILRDFLLDGNSGAANGILITNADQAGGLIYGEELLVTTATGNNFWNDAVNSTLVELHDFQSAAGAVGLSNTGAGTVNVFAAASYGNATLLVNSGGGKINARQWWSDLGGSSNTVATLTGTGSVSIASMAAFLSAGSSNALSFNNFTGTSTILGLDTQESGGAYTGNADEVISGTGASTNLNAGMLAPTLTPFSNSSTGSTSVFVDGQTTNGCPAGCGGQGSQTVTENNAGSLTAGFLNTALASLRAATPTIPAASASGATDVELYRVWAQGTINGIHVQH